MVNHIERLEAVIAETHAEIRNASDDYFKRARAREIEIDDPRAACDLLLQAEAMCHANAILRASLIRHGFRKDSKLLKVAYNR